MTSSPYPPAAPLVPDAWLGLIARLPADGGPTGAIWSRRARQIVIECLDQWDLTVTGPARTGWTAVAFPVDRDGAPAVLKVGWPHRESAAEHTALRLWGGRGAVRLLAADPARGALLLERLDPTRTLGSEDAFTACEIAGGLLRRLHVPAPPTIPPLRDLLAPHLERLGHGAVPRRFAARTRSLAEELLPDPTHVVLHTDLHYDNVLGAEREPWLAIDPKPAAGHPGFEFQPLLRNRVDELGTGSALRRSVRHRLQIAADAAGVDAEEARLWSLLHTGIQILWAHDDPAAASLHVALFKALED
ncbi:MAG: aminoglycoside phosphotransferase family protein [Intrasporangiaceae bacterium]|nr:aminoglycoside phosphotransferase family protein [Intrasporangiaceae bacterium]